MPEPAKIIKSIETIYKGFKFRSRLEARWAVFFDALHVPWEYEKEGFDIEGEWYLPDFYLPKQRTYIEIKPNPGNNKFSHISKLKFYLAGKISDDDWRTEIIDDGKVFGYHEYCGPFYQELGWDHGRNNHSEILNSCISGIESCDILFAWLNSPYIHATLAEIGYAKALNKKIWVGVHQSFDDIHGSDYWFILEMADQRYYDTWSASALEELIYSNSKKEGHKKYMILAQKEEINNVIVFYGSPGYGNEFFYKYCKPYKSIRGGFLIFDEYQILTHKYYHSDEIKRALHIGKQSRFEHGEKG